MTHEEALTYCRYYNEENKCPFDLKSRQSRWWDIEETWIKLVITDEYRFNGLCNEFLDAFPDGLKSIVNTPISLKAILYDQYFHWHNSKDGFEDWLFVYLKDSYRLISNMNIPKQILLLLEEYDMNDAEEFTYDGKTYYSLAYVAEDGTPIPTGPPVIVLYLDGEAIELPTQEAFEILKNIDDE